MDRRRALAQKRPPPSEEHDAWAKATAKIMRIGDIAVAQEASERINRVNKLMMDADHAVAVDDYELFKTIQKKLTPLLSEIKTTSESENTAVTEALETLSVLKALRTAEIPLAQEKRNKRQRASPALNGTVGTPTRTGVSPPHRAPTNNSRSHQKKSTPILREGRVVGFRVPADAENRDANEAEWILATIVKSNNANEYVVQDVDQEGGIPGPQYTATLQDMLLIPDTADPKVKDPFRDVPGFSPGTMVLALYPETTSFYRAQVISGGPKESRHATTTKATPTYRLKFDDDEDQEKVVGAEWVVEHPGGKA